MNLARVIFAPLIQPAATTFNVTPASLGVVTSAAWLGSAAPRLPTGYLLTRFSRHNVILSAGSLLAIASGLTAFSTSVVELTAGAFVIGIASGVYFIAANPLLSELFTERVGQVIGLHGSANQVAAVIAPLVLSLLLLFTGWRSVFFVISGGIVVSTIIFFRIARKTKLPYRGEEDRSLWIAGRAQWRLILTGFVFVGAVSFLWNGLFNLYGDYLTVVKGIDPATGRILLSVLFAAGVPAFFISGKLADITAEVPLLLTIISSFAICVLILTFVQGILSIVVISILLGFIIHSLFPAVDTYLLSTFPDRHRASAYAIYSACMMIAQGLGSSVIGLTVASGISYTLVFRGLAIGIGILTVCLFIIYVYGYLPTSSDP